jgi:hypothetical protein
VRLSAKKPSIFHGAVQKPFWQGALVPCMGKPILKGVTAKSRHPLEERDPSRYAFLTT